MDIVKTLLSGWLLILLLACAAAAADDKFPGPLQPGQILGNTGTMPAPAAPIPGRIQLTEPTEYWVNASPTSPAICGVTGMRTCAAGSDSNDCLSPATACLTLQHVVDFIFSRVDVAGYPVAIYLAHGASANYSIVCEAGPVIGQSTISVFGDHAAPTAVTIVAPAEEGSVAIAFKDGCTIGFVDVAFHDNAAMNATNFINGGVGQAGHIDLSGVSFGALGRGVAIGASYGSSFSIRGSCAITGSEVAFLSLSAGAVVDFASTCDGASGLTFSTAFAIYASNAVIYGVSPTTFTGFSGVAGPRCVIYGPITSPGYNPNAIFPGSTDCVQVEQVGAVGVQTGSGATSSYNFGHAGQPLLSQGGDGGNPNIYGTLGVGGGGTGNTAQAAHAFLLGEGTSPQGAAGPCTANQMPIGQGPGADPICGTASQIQALILQGVMASQPIRVDFSRGGDNAIAIVLPVGYSQLRPSTLAISQCTGSLTGATFGLYTGTGGGGAALVTAGATSTVTNNAANTINNYQEFASFNGAGALAYTPADNAVQFRVGATVPATCFIVFRYFPIP
jgi:hypothetical protein